MPAIPGEMKRIVGAFEDRRLKWSERRGSAGPRQHSSELPNLRVLRQRIRSVRPQCAPRHGIRGEGPCFRSAWTESPTALTAMRIDTCCRRAWACCLASATPHFLSSQSGSEQERLGIPQQRARRLLPSRGWVIRRPRLVVSTGHWRGVLAQPRQKRY
jgi:hypothetical protein